MKALQIFEAAARHLNFTNAAIELNLTQTAVSHQIRNLENMLDAQLFSRGAGLQLTPAGEAYLPAAKVAIAVISEATERAQYSQRSDTLTIACLGTYLIKTLLPNIEDFRLRHPELSLCFKVLSANEPAAPRDYDVGVQYGVGQWTGVSAYPLGQDTVFPVCSPRLLDNGPRLKTPEDLQHHTIIRTRSPLLVRDDWPFWLDCAGVPKLTFSAEMTFDLLYPAFQAAIEGLGIVMGRTAVVRNDLAAGHLVEPFDVRIKSPAGYYVVVPAGREDLPKIIAFRNWAIEYLGPHSAWLRPGTGPLDLPDQDAWHSRSTAAGLPA